MPSAPGKQYYFQIMLAGAIGGAAEVPMPRRSRLAGRLGGAVLPLVLAAGAAAGATAVAPVAYRAEVIVVANGVTTRSLVFSDGVRRRTETAAASGETSGPRTRTCFRRRSPSARPSHR